MKYIIIAVALLTLILIACKTIKKQKPVYQKPTKAPLFTIAKTKCFGRCPVFQCKIYDDGTLLFNGEKNVDYIGEHSANLPTEWISELKEKAEACQFSQLKAEYLSNLPDKAKTILTYKGKKVTLHKRNASKELKALISLWDDLLKHIELKKISSSTHK